MCSFWITACIKAREIPGRRRGCLSLNSAWGRLGGVPCQSWIRVECAESASAAAGNDSISRPFIPRRVRGHRNLLQLAAGRLADRLTLPRLANWPLATRNAFAHLPQTPPLKSEKEIQSGEMHSSN